jgi:probable rRNA maturation factor
MASINFFSQDIPFKLKTPRKTSAWIVLVLKAERRKLEQLNFVFCSDQYLSDLNTQYLKHKTLTDIITFDNSEGYGNIEGDVFISIDRVKENSVVYSRTFEDELHRVIIHGVLHLIGYSDKTSAKKAEMRKKEDACLSLRK